MRHWPSDRIGRNEIYGWICDECGKEQWMKPLIKRLNYHIGECGWCGADVAVSNAEDWTKKSKGRTK